MEMKKYGFFFKNTWNYKFFLVIMDGENKIYSEEEKIGKSDEEEQNKKILEKIANIKESTEQFFNNISKDELWKNINVKKFWSQKKPFFVYFFLKLLNICK